MVNSSLRVASDDKSGTASISWYLQDLAATKVSVFELYSDVGRMECAFFFLHRASHEELPQCRHFNKILLNIKRPQK